MFRWTVDPRGNNTVISVLAAQAHPVWLGEPEQQSTIQNAALHSDCHSVGSGSLEVRTVLDTVEFLTSNIVLE